MAVVPDTAVIQVLTRSRRLVGYGIRGNNGLLAIFSVHRTGDDEFEGYVVGSTIEFGSSKVAGTVNGKSVVDGDGDAIGTFDGDALISIDGQVIGYADGNASTAEKAGAVVLVIESHWNLPDRSENPNIL